MKIISSKRSLKRIRKTYARCQKGEIPPTGVYEWLCDNYYLYQREAKWASEELKRANKYTLSDSGSLLYELCFYICKTEREMTDEDIVEKIRNAELTVFEIDLLPAFYRAVLLSIVVQCITEDNTENRRKISYATSALAKVSGIDAYEFSESVSPLEDDLRADPANIYSRMSKETRAVYRRRIGILAKNAGVNEKKLLKARISLAAENNDHIGNYLNLSSHNTLRGRFFIFLEIFLAIILSFAVWHLTGSVLLAFCAHLPVWALCSKFTLKASLNNVAPDSVLRMDRADKLVTSTPTMIVVSVLLPDAAKIVSLQKHLRILRSGNPGKNITICVLADLKPADAEKCPEDEGNIKALKNLITMLNETTEGGFIGLVRPREYSNASGGYAGRERKRGAIEDLVRIVSVPNARNNLLLECGETETLGKVEYILVLDADTDLPMDCVFDLLSAALHPVNDAKFGVFVPSLEVKISDAAKTPFAEIFAGSAGISSYNGLSSERYQDLFGNSLFSGKGLISVKKFSKAFLSENGSPFKAETVLSHDIIEGEILNTLLVSDTAAVEGFPLDEPAYFTRQDRWTRGDIQNIAFLFGSLCNGNKLSKLSKYKLADNIRRAWTPIMQVAALFVSGFVSPVVASVTAIIVFASLSNVFEVFTLFQSAYINLVASIKALYRRFVSHRKTLEWITAAQAQKRMNFSGHFRVAYPSVIGGVALLFLPGLLKIFGITFIFNPLFSTLSSKLRENIKTVGWTEREKLTSYAASTWKYYGTYVTGNDNYLPPDNVQEAPVYRVAHRTSPTNIGFYMLCTLSACDFGFIDIKELISRLEKTVSTVEKLRKFRGNLLNWYDTETLEPLRPQYVSTVDSGNFLCLITALVGGLSDYEKGEPKILDLKKRLTAIIDNTDISFLYSAKRRLFRVGYNVLEQEFSESYYDLLMSEARMTGYYAIATRKVPREHWSELSRIISKSNGHFGPLSWTGTTFEFYLPHLLLPVYKNSLSEQALKYCDYCQKKRVANAKIPYGMSESGFYAFDKDLNYQYKAHGVQKLGLRRGLNSDCVISPYSTFLMLPYNHKSALQNLDRLAELDMVGKCGFYEAVDFTRRRTGGQDYVIVRSYMAHHVGMSMLSLSNAAFNNIMQHRFMSDNAMIGAQYLLMEKVPKHAQEFRDVSDRKEPIKPARTQGGPKSVEVAGPVAQTSRIYTNGEWSLLAFSNGMCRSLYRGIDITVPPVSSYDFYAGVRIYEGHNKIPLVPTKAVYRKNGVTWLHQGARTSISMSASVHPRVPGELRRITLRNSGITPAHIRTYVWLNPLLANKKDGMSHLPFTKLFMVDTVKDSPNRLALITKNSVSGGPVCLVGGFLDDGVSSICTSNLDFFSARKMNTEAGSGAGVPDPCIALEVDFFLKPGKSQSRYLFLGAASGKDEAEKMFRRVYEDKSLITDGLFAPELFDDDSPERMIYPSILPELFYPYALEDELREKIKNTIGDRYVLWKFGISGNNPILFQSVTDNASLQNARTSVRMISGLKRSGINIDLVLCYDDRGNYTSPIKRELDLIISGEGGVVDGNVFAIDSSLHDATDIESLMAASSRVSDKLIKDEVTSFTGEFIKIEDAHESRKTSKSDSGRFKVVGGYFDTANDSQNAFHITNKTDLPWCHCLANRSFGTLVSNMNLGYTWGFNSRENKLTNHSTFAFSAYEGERVICKLNDRYYDIIRGSSVTFYPNFAVYESKVESCRFKVVVYVPEVGMCKQIRVTVKNTGNSFPCLKLGYYAQTILGVDEETRRYLSSSQHERGIAVSNGHVWGIKGFAYYGIKDSTYDFYTCNTLDVLTGNWDTFTDMPCAESCVLIGKDLRLTEDETKTITFTQSFALDENAAVFLGSDFNAKMPIYTPKLKIATNDVAMNIMVNTWLPAQMKNCRMFGRSGFYQSGGAYGFRDQLQDAMNIQIIYPNLAREFIIRSASVQFKEGDVLHWWHNFPKINGGIKGIRTRCSDDMLWLPYALANYCMHTGDKALPKLRVAFLAGETLEATERERYASFEKSTEIVSLYEHARRAIEVGLNFGKDGLIKIGACDWNDGYSSVGAKGDGESVWLSMFVCIVLDKFADFTEQYIEGYEEDYVDDLRRISANLKTTIDATCWDGEWYTRAIYDDGDIMGSRVSKECKIDSLSQSFAVLSGMPDTERVNTAISNAVKYLYDMDAGIARLFWPPFTPEGKSTGYVNFYAPGTRENGGQYTHAAVWLAMALLEHGNKCNEAARDVGIRLIRDLNPINKYHSEETAKAYLGEPYAMAGDVYSVKPYRGRAGWTLYTGAAGWYYKTVVTSLLGIDRKDGKLITRPCVPEEFSESTVEVQNSL